MSSRDPRPITTCTFTSTFGLSFLIRIARFSRELDERIDALVLQFVLKLRHDRIDSLQDRAKPGVIAVESGIRRGPS
jgi:hypothetical protein